MKRHLISLTLAAVLALSCQSADEAYAAPETQELASIYADYLAGSYAHHIRDRRAKKDFFTKAYLSQPSDTAIGRLAVKSAIAAGDMASAVTLSQRLLKSDKTNSIARAVLGVDAFRRGRESRALKYLSGQSDDKPNLILMQLVRGWTEVQDKDYDAARETFANLSAAHSYFEVYGELQMAKVDGLVGDTEEALERLDAVDEKGVAGVESLLTRVRILDNVGRQDEAITAIEEILTDNDGLSVGPVGLYLKNLKAGAPIPKISVKGEAARAVTDPALEFFAASRNIDDAEYYLRIANWIDPENTKAMLLLGSILQDQGDTGRDAAFDLYQSIGEDNPYYVSAQRSVANIQFAREEDEQAIVTLEKINAREETILIESLSDEELKANIEPLRFRGIIYERLKRWPEAEADFKRVLEIVPDDVETLNYLGYTWVDRGENLTEAFDMIRDAVEQEPRSGAIVDSLGWAHYKLGEYEEAKVNLEKAVALSPSSATIVDHLGDVYWKLGRKREAGFQWKRALLFEPTDKERETIDIKLKGGLEAVPPATNDDP